MIAALIKAFGQASDPAFRRVIVKGAAAAIVLFLALVAGAAWGLEHFTLTTINWVNQIIAALGGIATVIIAGLLFPGAIMAVQGIFLDDAALSVETRHYPDAIGTPPPTARAIWGSLRLAGITIAFNLVVLPLYFFPAINLIVFYSLNGYLLGREYFEVVALRHMTLDAARTLRRRNRWPTFIAGILITFLFTIPVANWFMPAFATAFMEHVFDAARRRGLLIQS
jgi:CysZ protein